jgi:glutamyl-tRNA reductase
MFVLGLSHRTAPIEVRERVALDEDGAAVLLQHLVERGSIDEAMVVSTCNRIELYVVPASERDDARAVDDALEALRFARSDIGRVLYLHADKDAVRHVFRVAASLDSLVVGEPQILGQLKVGFERARSLGVVGANLNRIVTRAFRAAKRVRTETSIGSGQVSVATVALDLARQIFDQLRDRTVALVGSGEMGESIAQLFQQAGARMVIVGRNEQRVLELARRVGGEGRLLTELEPTLVDADVVVTSTSASLPIIGYEQVRSAMKRRRGRDLFFVDVAVPRDVDERAGKIGGVYLYNIDDLSSVVAETQLNRQEGASQAERVISEELQKLDRREESEQVTPTVRALYDWFGDVLRAEVDRSLQGNLRGLSSEDRLALTRLADAATKKLLHRPVTTLRRWAVERPLELQTTLEMMHDLFLPTAPQQTSEVVDQSVESCRPNLANDLSSSASAESNRAIETTQPATPASAQTEESR